MKKGTVLSLKSLRTKLMNNDKTKLIFMAFLIFGILCGIILFSEKQNTYKIIDDIVTHYISLRLSSGFLKIFSISFLTLVIFYSILFFSSISLIGTIFIPFSVIIIGYLFGSVISYDYMKYSLKGLAFNAVILFPIMIIFSLCLLFIAKYSIDFSLTLSNLIIKREKAYNISNQFNILFKKYILLIPLSVVIAIIDSLLSFYFLQIFDFKI